MTTEHATVPVMETGTYGQELDLWRRTASTTARPMPCPWPDCDAIPHGAAQLHAHLDHHHEGHAP